MFKKLKRHFFSGLIIFVPLSLTIYFVRFFFILMSEVLLPLFDHVHWIDLPHPVVRTLSFFLTLFLIWFLGVTASNFIGKRIVAFFEKGIHHIPFFRGLYEAIQKITEAFFGVNSIYQSAVLVEYPRQGTYTFGFVTSRMPGRIFGAEVPYLCVFIPTVPNPTSGVLLYVAESQTISLSLSIEEVVKILVSHGFVPIPEAAVKRG